MLDKHTAIQFGSEPPLTSPRECPACASRFGESARFCPFDGEALRVAEDAKADPLVGTVVDERYHVDCVLGEGGMGTVYRATHQTLERPFALKALRGDLSREGDLAERFLREARSAAAIQHPNVCEITDFGYLPGGRPYFAMELLTGRPLNWWLAKGGPLPVGSGVRIVQQIAGVLEAAHQAGIVHRDLKPDNVIVDDVTTGARVKVVDFGLAQVAGKSRLTRPGMVYGTPHYMSPEQAMGDDVDHRSDIYALGIVMYEMFTGRVPFEADTYMGVLTKHMYVAPTPPSEIVANAKEMGALEDVILRCMQKRPERRYQRMVDLQADLSAILTPTADGGVKVAPKRVRGPETPELPRLADELELPTRAELHRDLARFERRRLPWVLLGVIAVGGVAALLGLGYRNSVQQAPEVTPAQGANQGIASTLPAEVTPPISSVAGPDQLQNQAAAGTRSDQGLDAPSNSAPARNPEESGNLVQRGKETSMPKKPDRGVQRARRERSEAEQPEPEHREPDHKEPAAAATDSLEGESTERSPDFVTGEIVDPWQN